MDNYLLKPCVKCKSHYRAKSSSYCSSCRNEYQRNYIKQNKEQIKQKWKNRYDQQMADPEYRKRVYEWSKKRRVRIKESDPEKYKELKRKKWEYAQKERKNKPWLRARRAVSKRINKARVARKVPPYNKDLNIGCDIYEFKLHIESLWGNGMSWENYGKGSGSIYWEIDHITPIKNFDLAIYEEALLANHYTNLQPLWSEDHKRKSLTESQLFFNNTPVN